MLLIVRRQTDFMVILPKRFDTLIPALEGGARYQLPGEQPDQHSEIREQLLLG